MVATLDLQIELAIMSLADCAVTIFADVAKKSNVEISKMEVVAEAEKPADSPRLTSVNLKVTVASKARKQKLDAVWRRIEANCPVVSIFQDNIPIEQLQPFPRSSGLLKPEFNHLTRIVEGQWL